MALSQWVIGQEVKITAQLHTVPMPSRRTARSEPGGTRWRTGGEVKGKLANGVGSQYSSHSLGTWFIQHYYR